MPTAKKRTAPAATPPMEDRSKPIADLSNAARMLAEETKIGNAQMEALDLKLDAVLEAIAATAFEREAHAAKEMKSLARRLTRLEKHLSEIAKRDAEAEAPMEPLPVDFGLIERRLDGIEESLSGLLERSSAEKSFGVRLDQISQYLLDGSAEELEAAQTVRKTAEQFRESLEARFAGLEAKIDTLTEANEGTNHREDMVAALAEEMRSAFAHLEECFAANAARFVRTEQKADRQAQVAVRLLIDDFRNRMQELGSLTEEAKRGLMSASEEAEQRFAGALQRIAENQEKLHQLLESSKNDPRKDLYKEGHDALVAALTHEIAEIRPTLAKAVSEILRTEEVRQAAAGF